MVLHSQSIGGLYGNQSSDAKMRETKNFLDDKNRKSYSNKNIIP
jgi:hypothetical protein